MTGKWTGRTEITRLLQKPLINQIKPSTSSDIRDSKQVDREDKILEDTFTPDPDTLPISTHPRRKRTKTKTKLVKSTPHRYQKLQEVGSSRSKKSSSRVAVYLANDITVCECHPSDRTSPSNSSEDSKLLKLRCSCSESYTSSSNPPYYSSHSESVVSSSRIFPPLTRKGTVISKRAASRQGKSLKKSEYFENIQNKGDSCSSFNCNRSKLLKFQSQRITSTSLKSAAPKSATHKSVAHKSVSVKSRIPVYQQNKKQKSVFAKESTTKQHLLSSDSNTSVVSRRSSVSHFSSEDSMADPNQSNPGNKSVQTGESEDSSYDPHMHREVEKPTNNYETLAHLVKCSLGTGILAMPQAFANAGFITGIVFTIVIGILITHCLRMLIGAQYVICQRKRVSLLSYSDSMVAAMEMGPASLRRFAKCSGIMVDIFLITLQLGICCVYIVFIGSTIKRIVDPYYLMPVEYHMLIILGPLIAANCIPNLKILAPFSLVANVLIIVSLIIALYYLTSGPKNTTENLDLWGSIYTFPLFFGTCLFSLTAVAVVLSVENNSKNPKDFVKPFGVLNIGMSLVVLLYVMVGALGYVFCKSKCQDSILFNLPGNTPAVVAVLVMYAIAMLISYVLQCFVPVEIIWNKCFMHRLANASKAKQKFWEYVLRIGICIFTFSLAVAIPRLGLFIALVGALCLSASGMLFPPLMEICNRKDDLGRCKYVCWKNALIMVVGTFGFFVGTVTSIVEIVQSFRK